MSETLKTIIGYLITLIGGWLISRNVELFGKPIDANTMELIGGIVLALAGVVYSIIRKTLTLEMLSGSLRHILATLGTMLTGAGVINEQTATTVIGIITTLIPLIWSWITSTKNARLQRGEIQVQQLKSPLKKKVA